MREILFRGKRQDTDEWVEGFYVGANISARYYEIFVPTECLWSRYIIDPSTVGQYTGLTDKNGVKIFEGDIVHYVYAPRYEFWKADQLSVIVWDSTGFKLDGIEGTNKYALMQGWMVSIPQPKSAFEVIGNIHDNPELLKGGDQT